MRKYLLEGTAGKTPQRIGGQQNSNSAAAESRRQRLQHSSWFVPLAWA
jgi:hypothetical protein